MPLRNRRGAALLDKTGFATLEAAPGHCKLR